MTPTFISRRARGAIGEVGKEGDILKRFTLFGFILYIWIALFFEGVGSHLFLILGL